MRCYLPPETEVVILASGSYSWFTTTTEMDVTNYVQGICPLRSRLECLTANVDGMQVWFLESQAKVELPEEMQAHVNYGKLVTLEYDIPAIVSSNPTRYPDETGKSFQHPCIWMWGIGSRTSKSVWLLQAERIPYRRIRTLIRAGCNYRVTYVDSSDIANHLQRTVITLRNEWLQAEQSYVDCMQSAQDRHNERIAEEKSMDLSEELLKRDHKRVEKELEKRKKNILAGAALFSVPVDWVTKGIANLASGQARVEVFGSLRNAVYVGNSLMDSRVDAHCNAVDALEQAGHTEIASELENGNLPHDIAADYAEENEVLDSETTYSLRELFKD